MVSISILRLQQICFFAQSDWPCQDYRRPRQIASDFWVEFGRLLEHLSHQSGFDPIAVTNEHINIPLAFLASKVQHKLCWQFRYAADHAAICFPQK